MKLIVDLPDMLLSIERIAHHYGPIDAYCRLNGEPGDLPLRKHSGKRFLSGNSRARRLLSSNINSRSSRPWMPSFISTRVQQQSSTIKPGQISDQDLPVQFLFPTRQNEIRRRRPCTHRCLRRPGCSSVVLAPCPRLQALRRA